MTQNLGYPYHFNALSRTATAGEDRHIRDMIEQVLFTSPGERVNRPTFGSGVQQLVFAPNHPELVVTVQHLVQSALQQWLGELIHTESVTVENRDSELMITIAYVVRASQQRNVTTFTRGAATA